MDLRGLPRELSGKESACNVGDLGLTTGLGRSPGEGKGYPLQCSGLENPMDCIVHGFAKSWTRLSNFYTLTLTMQCHKQCSLLDKPYVSTCLLLAFTLSVLAKTLFVVV